MSFKIFIFLLVPFVLQAATFEQSLVLNFVSRDISYIVDNREIKYVEGKKTKSVTIDIDQQRYFEATAYKIVKEREAIAPAKCLPIYKIIMDGKENIICSGDSNAMGSIKGMIMALQKRLSH